MYSRYPKMRPLGLVIWRLRHSRLRREFHLRILEALSAARPEGLVLDVGSGPGLLAGRIARAHPAARVICLDVEPGMLEAARTAGCRDVVRASADRIPFRSGTFPVVVSTASLKDWADRQGGLTEMLRVLRPGGRGFAYDFITVGPGSDPPGFVRRFGLVAELLRRRMARAIPFSMNDLEGLAAAVRGSGSDVRVERVPDFGAAGIAFTKPASS